MNLAAQRHARHNAMLRVRLRLRGRVQGVGMRPHIWRLARELNLQGQVYNEGADVVVELFNGATAAGDLIAALQSELPPLAVVEEYEQDLLPASVDDFPEGFEIADSEAGQGVNTALPDAATCPACLAEIRDPDARRFRYAFTSCTHCGPRFSIQQALPWDRARTSMADFSLCTACEAEYHDPTDRRFHAQPLACPDCGPQLQLQDAQGHYLACEAQDELTTAAECIRAGQIVALKGLGGFHLACDARNEQAVARLRAAKQREDKPFAVMVRDVDVAAAYCVVDALSETCLCGPAAPILLLPRRATAPALASTLAPGLNELGVMLPSTPLHHLLLESFDFPLVMTSGNLSAAPPCTDNDAAFDKLAGVADVFLIHDRPIVNRLDDSVFRQAGGTLRPLRLARGFAPWRLPLPAGFNVTAPVLAMGGELKSTFCLLDDEAAVLSQHFGDLESAENLDDFERGLKHYAELFRFSPAVIAVDRHPEYLSRKHGLAMASATDCAVVEVQHHHAHIAACLADNAVPFNRPPVLGIALDGLGMGEAGELWGGECLLADYQGFRRLGRLKPMPLPGGVQAFKEPWRNAYAHLVSTLGWESCEKTYAGLEVIQWLRQRPLAQLDQMMAQGINSPLSSSAGRWFDAVAATLGLCSAKQNFEGQAAMQLEALVDKPALSASAHFYPFSVKTAALCQLDPGPMWRALLDDLLAGVAPAVVAARFHGGLAQGLMEMVRTLRQSQSFNQVVLTGGVFQNRVLFELLSDALERLDIEVLSHRQVPANDGGLALGQALVAAARQVKTRRLN